MGTTLLKISIPVLLIGYAVAGYYSQYSYEGEMYPFFAWQLFTHVPERIGSEYSIRVLEIQGRKIDAPVPYSAQDGFLSGKNQPTEYWLMFQFLGRAYQEGDEANIAKYRSVLEKCFTAYPVRYELVLATKDAIDYWKYKTYISVHPLAAFYANDTFSENFF